MSPTAPTVVVGPESSYSANVIVVRQLENYIDNFSPKEFPLLSSIGMNSYPNTIENTKFEWQRDSAIPLSDAVYGAHNDTGATALTVHFGEYFALGDVILVESELMQVSAADASTNVLTVTRGFAGSTAATHADDTVIYRLGNARPEGSSPGWARQTTTTQPFNYTQIWDETASVTGTEKVMKNYAPDDLMAWRIDARMAEMYQLMERAYLYNGFRYAGTAAIGRLTAGLNYWVYDKNNIAAALTYDDIEDVLQEKFAYFGTQGVPDQIWVNGYVKRKISTWGMGSIRTDRAETAVGNVVDTLEGNFGTVSVNLDHLIIASEAWLVRSDKLQMGPLTGRAFAEIDASVPGDDEEIHRVLGEYGFVIKGEDAAADGMSCKLYGISLTS
jgi:hypothetical protein